MSLSPGLGITLTTPSLGVRQWRDDCDPRHTVIAWATTGGRGLPRSAILLPVVFDEGRWRPAGDLRRDLANHLSRFRRVVKAVAPDVPDVDTVHPEIDDDPTAPRRLTVVNDYGAEWKANHLLVLLVYDEPRAVGDQVDIGQDAVGQHAAVPLHPRDAIADRQELEAIAEFFDPECYDGRLVTRGLVRLPAPDAADTPGPLVFALASCQQPADIFDGAGYAPDPPASASLLRLSKLLASEGAPSLIVLAGDQVYVDATAGLFDARAATDRLRLPYQRLMGSPGALAALGMVPVAMVMDDHEIIDNWEPGVPIPPPTTKDQAVNAYRRFQRMAGPPLQDANALWREFSFGGIPFFLADTRSDRLMVRDRPRGVENWRRAKIMGDEQWEALRDFLDRHKDEVAFVVSSAMLLPRDVGVRHEPTLALEADDWDGYPASRDELLALLCQLNARRIVFLSGDAHTSCVAQATVTRGTDQARLWSVHSSGLYCPYPFANGSEADYAPDETFTFPDDAADGERYSCKVKNHIWAPGDGFATLALTHGTGGSASLEVCFQRAGGKRRSPRVVLSIP